MDLAEIGEQLDQLLDIEYAEDWDNVGWMVGPTSVELKGIMLAVDPSPEALEATLDRDCNLLLTHHPLIFDSLDEITEGIPVHETIMRAIRMDVGIYAGHTNVDSMSGGLNDYLARETLNLNNVEPIHPHEDNDQVGLGRIGTLSDPASFENIQNHIADEIEPTIVECIGDAEANVESIGLCTGSGGDFIGPSLKDQVDLYITADVDHHQAMTARQLGLPLIILDHYEMESVFIPVVKSLLGDSNVTEIPIETHRRSNPYRRTVR